jgi:hypothetical protein
MTRFRVVVIGLESVATADQPPALFEFPLHIEFGAPGVDVLVLIGCLDVVQPGARSVLFTIMTVLDPGNGLAMLVLQIEIERLDSKSLEGIGVDTCLEHIIRPPGTGSAVRLSEISSKTFTL